MNDRICQMGKIKVGQGEWGTQRVLQFLIRWSRTPEGAASPGRFQEHQ